MLALHVKPNLHLELWQAITSLFSDETSVMSPLQQVATELFIFKDGRQSGTFFILLTQHYYHVLDSLSSLNRIEKPFQCDCCPAGLSVCSMDTLHQDPNGQSHSVPLKNHRTHNRLILFLFFWKCCLRTKHSLRSHLRGAVMQVLHSRDLPRGFDVSGSCSCNDHLFSFILLMCHICPSCSCGWWLRRHVLADAAPLATRVEACCVKVRYPPSEMSGRGCVCVRCCVYFNAQHQVSHSSAVCGRWESSVRWLLGKRSGFSRATGEKKIALCYEEFYCLLIKCLIECYPFVLFPCSFNLITEQFIYQNAVCLSDIPPSALEKDNNQKMRCFFFSKISCKDKQTLCRAQKNITNFQEI